MSWLRRIVYSAVWFIRITSLRLLSISSYRYFSRYRYLKNFVFAFWYWVRIPKQKYSKLAMWNQVQYQMYWRNPKMFIDLFNKMLKVSITYKCNVECRYCFAKGLINEFPIDMSINNFYRLITWGKEKGYDNISFVGGESTIHPQFTEMLEICYRNRMFIQINTNNLFSHRIIPKLNRHWIFSIIINYMLGDLNNEQKALFRDNLKQMQGRKIPFGFSYILNYEKEDWLELSQDLKRYNPCYLWACLPVPGVSRQSSFAEILNNIRPLLEKIFQLQDTCIKLNVPFNIFRPLPSCVFSQKEWQKIRKIFPFFAFMRCLLGYKGNYASMVLINPDLSIFPCSSVFIKGPNILSFKDRRQISDFYKDKIKELVSEPLIESCRDCEKHKRFMLSLEDIKSKYSFDEDICQGGCLNFREKAHSFCKID